MKQMKRIFSLLTCCLLLGSVSSAYGAVDAAEGFAVNKAGEFNEVSIIYGDSEGRGISIGINYTLTNSAVAVTEKPEGAKVEAYFTSHALKDFNSTGKATLMAYCDTPGDVTASILLTFTDEATGDVKYVTGTVDMTFRDPAEIPQDAIRTTIFTIGSASMICDGQVYAIDQAAFIADGRTYVPLRAAAEAFGLAVVYNEETGYIRLTHNDQEMTLQIDSTEVTLSDGSTLQMDAPVRLGDNRAMLPVRYIAQILGGDVSVTIGENQNIAQVVINR